MPRLAGATPSPAGHRELPAALLQEFDQESTLCRNVTRREHQPPSRLLTHTGTHLPGLVPLRALLPGLGLLPVWRFVQGTLQVFVEVALQVQGVVSNFHFQVVQGTLLLEERTGVCYRV